MEISRCAEAAGTTGKVFVIERTGSDGKSPDTERDLQQLVYFGGRDRAVSEITDLAGDVGLELVQAHPAGISKVIELTFPTPLVVRDRRQARHGLNEQRGMIPL